MRSSALDQCHLTWYLQTICPILSAAQAQALTLVREERRPQLLAHFREFKQQLLVAIEIDAVVWEQTVLWDTHNNLEFTAALGKAQAEQYVRRGCDGLIRALKLKRHK
jgi:hypothetical protein